jgi:hypothetical protein
MTEETKEKKEKLTFKNRNLMEFIIDPDERDDTETLISWLADHSTAPHAEAEEFFLWIPPYSGYKRSMRLTYGKDIPDYINKLLLAAIEVRKNEEDQGYLLIAFI